MGSFRFVHTGDIHLDSPLKGLSGQQGPAAERIRTATRVAFDNLVTQAIEDEIDFVVIAGDLYDGDWRDYQTGLFFVKQMGRLAQVKIPVFLLHGNHDAESQITRKLTLPTNVSVFPTRKAETFRLPHLNVALHGQSFRQRDITDNLVPAYPSPIAGCFNIGVLHTGLGGMPGHANYAPCAIEDLINKGYDYWALAHVHQAAVLHEQPHVVFCGNLQGRHIRESGPKGASLVAVEDGEVQEISPLHVDCVRWIHLPVPVEQCSAVADAADRVRQAIEEAVEREAQGRLLACRIELMGQTGLHGALLASADHLVAEAKAAALGLGEEVAWIERLVVATASPETAASRKDALGDLQRMIETAGSDAELQARLATDLGDLVRKLPHDIRTDADDAVLKAAIDGNIAGLIAHGGAYLAAIIDGLPQLDAARPHVEGLHQRAASERARLAEDLANIERLLSTLRGGGTYMSKDTQDFLADMSRMGIPAQSLSEVADIAPAFAQWRGIVESILGDWVDAVIIEPRFMDKAYAHFDSNYKATKAKLIQSENVSAQDWGNRQGTLAEAVVTENSYARAFINVRLGRIVRARSANDIRKGDLAASAEGKYAHGRGIEYRKLYPIPRLGKSVRAQQIAQLTLEQQDLQPLHEDAKERETRLLAVVEALRKAATVLAEHAEDALETLSKIESADAESKRQADLIADLEAELPEGVLEQRRELEAMLKAYREEQTTENEKERDLIGKIGHREGAMNANAEEREKAAAQVREVFPALERRTGRHDPAIGLERFARRARALYVKERASRDHPALIRNHFDALQKDKRLSHRNAVSRLITAVQEYVLNNPDQHPGFEWTRFIESEQTPTLHDWITLRHRHLKETVLRNFKEQVDKAVLALVETMVHDFLSRLRANIDSVERTKDDLNRALRGSVFMGEVYQIRQERDQDKDTIRYLIDRLDIIAPKATALMQSDLDPNDPDQVKIKELIEMLTFEASDDPAHRHRLRELSDYRNYFRFTIDICDPENEYRRISDLEQRRGKASGGQKFVPFYICLGVAAASSYHNHLGGSKEAPPQSALLLMDEAFEKLDPDNIYKVIQFYNRLGLQLIMAAPKTHQALYQETFDTLISIIRVGRAVQATAQHFHPAAHDLLHSENPMHKPRSYFEERVRWDGRDAAE